MKNQSINLKGTLRNDNVFITSEVKSLELITGMPTRRGLDRAIISEGEIVNVVSKSYGHLPNEDFYYEVERKLIDADIYYATRSINRENRSFAVDYILQDERYHINVKNGNDKIRPMLRFTNSYDGSCKTTGHFGFFREVCSNGLHVAHSNIGFSVKHRGDVAQIVIPEVRAIVDKFMDNEYYSIHRKFEVLAERPITDLKDFVKITAEKLDLFKFEASDSNPLPSLNARMVIDIVNREAKQLNTAPNMWLGYNAFNEVLHDKLKKTFEAQRNLDAKLLDTILAY